MTQRDDMGREVGGGFRIGNTCTPVVDSCQCMAKQIQYCKVKKKKYTNLRATFKAKKYLWYNLAPFLLMITYVATNPRFRANYIT